MGGSKDIYQPQDMALDLGGLLRAIARSLRWLLPLTLIVAALVFAGLQFVPEKFKGEARVLIETADALFPGAARGAEDERALLDSQGVASQVQLLTSVDLARRVAQRMNLASVPEFKAETQAGTLQQLLISIGLSPSPSRISAEERLLRHFARNLDVYRVEGSRVIAVEYSAKSAVLAAEIANAVVDEYLQMQSAAKRESRAAAASALEPQIRRMTQEVQTARKAVEDFRAKADLLTGAGDRTLNELQLSEISSQQSSAQAAEAEAAAKAAQLRRLLDTGGSLEGASEVLNSGLIQRLRERQVEIQSRVAELSTTLLPGHPQIRALTSQLADYDAQIRSEARKILTGLENDAAVAKQQAAALKSRVEELKAAAARSSADQVRLRELEREADARAVQLDALMASYRNADTGRNAETLPADARVISRAGVPIEPYSPKIGLFTFISALATFLLGCAIVILREFLSGEALKPVNEAEAYTAPVILRGPEAEPEDLQPEDLRQGEWPETELAAETQERVTAEEQNEDLSAETASDERLMRSPPDDEGQGSEAGAAEAERTRQAEAAGSLRAAASAASLAATPVMGGADAASEDDAADAAPRRVAVVALTDAELSHDFAFRLVRDLAGHAEERALLVEVFPESEDPGAAPGFADLVFGKASFSSVIYRDAGSRAHIIEAGRPALSDDVVDERFPLVLDAIDATYDRIVVDLGKFTETAAAAHMLGFADEVVVTVPADIQPRILAERLDLIASQTDADVRVKRIRRRKGSGEAAA
ncbi:exopolysaccharide transport family protein [Pannonibacter phragmitetus]|uniref:Succinoglycan transporter n=1 Tax=Pannonibacter phragmitetus TaxID=121719 RepID=A0A0U3PQ08_9HYPH|nr:exopolysaccharide transport family protein [Pannonibacter phragmitetus]ALV29373.1 succinoglycan transporter [Pannonibacter phragmitetus]